MNLILIAPPAAGKGTMASMLNKKYNLVCISAGELLRGVDPSTELGKKIREIQSRRELVDDSITNELMKERLMKDDVKGGFILDGYPRHMPQVTAIKVPAWKVVHSVDSDAIIPKNIAAARILELFNIELNNTVLPDETTVARSVITNFFPNSFL